MKLSRRQVLKAGLAVSTVYSPWMLGIAQSRTIKVGGIGFVGNPSAMTANIGSDDAKEYINETGLINGRKLEVAVEDTAGDPTKGLEALGKLMTREPDTLFIFGDSGPLTLLMAPELKRLMMPYTSPAYLKALANPQNFPSAFISGPTFEEMMLALLQGFKRLKSNATIAIVHPNNPFGSDALPAFKEQVAKDGLSIVLDEIAPPLINEAAAAVIVPKLLQANADFVVLQGYNMTGETVLVKAAKAAGVKSVFAGTYWSADVRLLYQAGAAADGFIVANHSVLHTDNVPALEEIRRFAARKGRPTEVSTTNNYIYAWRIELMRAEALRRADAAGKLTRPGVVEAVQSLTDFNAGGMFRDLKWNNQRLPYTKLYRLNAAAQKFEPMSDWINFA